MSSIENKRSGRRSYRKRRNKHTEYQQHRRMSTLEMDFGDGGIWVIKISAMIFIFLIAGYKLAYAEGINLLGNIVWIYPAALIAALLPTDCKAGLCKITTTISVLACFVVVGMGYSSAGMTLLLSGVLVPIFVGLLGVH